MNKELLKAWGNAPKKSGFASLQEVQAAYGKAYQAPKVPKTPKEKKPAPVEEKLLSQVDEKELAQHFMGG